MPPRKSRRKSECFRAPSRRCRRGPAAGPASSPLAAARDGASGCDSMNSPLPSLAAAAKAGSGSKSAKPCRRRPPPVKIPGIRFWRTRRMDGPATRHGGNEKQEALTPPSSPTSAPGITPSMPSASIPKPSTVRSVTATGQSRATISAFVRDYVAEGMIAICLALIEAGRSLTPFDYVSLLDSCRANPSARWQKRALKLFGIHCLAGAAQFGALPQGRHGSYSGRGAEKAQRFAETRHAEVHLKATYFFEELQAFAAYPAEMARVLSRMGPLTKRRPNACAGRPKARPTGKSRRSSTSRKTPYASISNLLRRLNATRARPWRSAPTRWPTPATANRPPPRTQRSRSARRSQNLPRRVGFCPRAAASVP